MQKTLIVVVGPTAIGKTTLAIEIANYLNTEIISADSRQFFKELEIGTAKPTADELAAAPHHFINSHSIEQFFSTGDFEIEALNVLSELFKTQNQVVMVGGSGLYINAICNGLDELPNINLSVRTKLNELFQNEGLEKIQVDLKKVDPEYYQKVDTQNPQRMIRALEVFYSTGIPLSTFLTNSKKNRPFNLLKIGLNSDRSVVYNRINKRVDLMMEAGLLKEVESLLPFKELNALKTVGYSEIFEYLEGNSSLQEAIDKIKQNTRRFAKRQLTWFNKDPEITWFKPSQIKEIIEFIQKSLN